MLYAVLSSSVSHCLINRHFCHAGLHVYLLVAYFLFSLPFFSSAREGFDSHGLGCLEWVVLSPGLSIYYDC